MPTETEELRLVISLTDNASAGVEALRQKSAQLSGGEAQSHIEKFKRGQGEMAKQIKEMSELVTGGEKAMVGFIGKFGVAGAAVAGFTEVLAKGIEGLNEYSSTITDLNNKAKTMGIHPAVLKSIREQLEGIGVSSDKADETITNFNKAYSEMGQAGSERHLRLVQMAGRFNHEMENSIQKVLHQRTEASRITEAMAQSEAVYNNRLKENNHDTVEATAFTKDFLAAWGIDPTVALVKALRETSQEEIEAMNRHTKATAQYQKEVVDLKHEWDDWMDDIKDSALAPDGLIVLGLKEIIKLVEFLHEINKPLEPGQRSKSWEDISKAWEKAGETPEDREKKRHEQAPRAATEKDRDALAEGLARKAQELRSQLHPSDQKNLADALGLNQLPDVKGAAAGAAGQAKVTPLMSVMTDTAEQHTDTMKSNTDQLKRLNDFLLQQQMKRGDVGGRMGAGVAASVAAAGGGTVAGAGGAAGGPAVSDTGGGGDGGGGGGATTGAPAAAGGAAAAAGGAGGAGGAGAAPGGGAAPLGGAGGGTKASQFISGMVARGWSKEAAAMMAGNVQVESGFNPREIGDRGTSAGLAQWHNERWENLKKFAAAGNRDWHDPDVQMDFLNKEFRGRFGDKAVASTDIGALEPLGKKFEGYATSTYGQRTAAGRRFLHEYEAGGQAQAAVAGDTGGAVKEAVSGVSGKGMSRGSALYEKLLAAYKHSNLVGKVPPDGARFGIKTGSAEEWAKFGTAVAGAESDYNPKTKNLSDPGGSFGVFQYAHGQVPGGNAYDVDASVRAFVRDSEQAVSSGGIRSRESLLRRRFSTIGSHPGSTYSRLGEASKLAEAAEAAGGDQQQAEADRSVVDKKSVKTVKVDATGKVAVNIGGEAGDATLGSSGLFKKTPEDRSTQMAKAESGPKTEAPAAVVKKKETETAALNI